MGSLSSGLPVALSLRLFLPTFHPSPFSHRCQNCSLVCGSAFSPLPLCPLSLTGISPSNPFALLTLPSCL